MSETLAIDALGAQGDGLGRDREGRVLFVPFTLPGERVAVERTGSRARLELVETASPERVEPPCPHFGTCGGCDLQHASADLYRAFKRERVAEALRRERVEAEVEALVPCAPASRRRAVFSARRTGARVLFGFHEALSERIVPIHVCLVVLPAIADALPLLRSLAETLIDRRQELRLTVAATAAGLDIAIEQAAKLTPALRQSALRLGLDPAVARLSVEGETLIENRPPEIVLAGIPVRLPPGAFLQAVASAEEEMAARAVPHLKKAKRVVDLFSGLGTFSLRLARASAVHAVESEAAPLASLDAARRTASGLKPVTTERRDLMRRPVTAKELDRFDGLLFDPPRAGAEAQCREIVRSKLPRVSAVSCNPATFARDAAILTEGGFRLTRVTPIDQFLWSHHVEVVGLFER